MKYMLTEETKNIGETTLYRIKALKDFGCVKAGYIGGWVEKEENLSQDGDAWVYEDAWVYGDAWVYEDACVYGDACVCGDARVYGNARVHGDACVYGNAWVYGNARVHGDARVYGDACVYGNAEVSSRKDLIVIDSIGSENGVLTAYKQSDGSIGVNRGCFHGTIDKFEEAVKKTHRGNIHAQIYLGLIPLIKLRLN